MGFPTRRFGHKTFRVFESQRLEGVKWKQGYFAQDAVGDWWLCLPVEAAVEQRAAPEESVGIDLGLKSTAVTNDGDRLEAGQFYRGLEPKIAQAACLKTAALNALEQVPDGLSQLP